MGIETAIGAAVVGSAVMGMHQQHRAAKQAKRAANEQSAAIADQQGQARAEQNRMNSRLDASKRKLAVGMARSNRGRTKGGLFGDSANAQAPVAAPNLGN